MKRRFIAFVSILLLSIGVFAADFAFPSLYLLSTGYFDASERFVVSTQFDFSLSFRSETNLNTEVALAFYTNSLESYFASEQTPLVISADPNDLASSLGILNDRNFAGIKRIVVEIPKVFAEGLGISFFSGHYDQLASESVLKKSGSYRPLVPFITSKLYMPMGVAGQGLRWYDGIHPVFGSGLKVAYTGKTVGAAAYIYQDAWLGSGNYTGNLRFMVYTPRIALDLFGGVSFPQGDWGLYSMGLFFQYNTGDIAEITTQIGVPYWMGGNALTMDMFYFMLEPRVNFGLGFLSLSLFFHPSYYAQQVTNESGVIDFKANLAFGSLEKGGSQAGIEAFMRFDPNTPSAQFAMAVSPYFSMNQAKTQWLMKLSMLVVPAAVNWYTIFSPQIMVQITE